MEAKVGMISGYVRHCSQGRKKSEIVLKMKQMLEEIRSYAKQ